MFQLYGQCYGFARNSEANTPDDKNCNWQSDDPYFQVAEIEDNPLTLKSLQDLMTYKKLQEHVVMTKTASSVSIGKCAFCTRFQCFPLFDSCFLFLTASMTSSGSGGFFAFAQESNAWVLKQFDSEDDAFSLCSFQSKSESFFFKKYQQNKI